MSTQDLQTTLAKAGYDPGPIDGKWGAHTLAALMGYAAQRKAVPFVAELADALVNPMIGKDITTPLRICHFLAQACEETEGWRYMVELGGQAYFAKYDGRLGNTHPGDGFLFRGRGLVMLTGRVNFVAFGQAIGLNLVDHPDQAAAPDVAARVAVTYWDEHGLNALADKDDIERITRAINGGINGLSVRQDALHRLKGAWGI